MDNFDKDVNKSLLPSNAKALDDKVLSQEIYELKRNESTHDLGAPALGPPVSSIKKRKRSIRPRQMPSDSSSSSTLSGSLPNLTDALAKEDFYDAYGSFHEFKDDNKVITILAEEQSDISKSIAPNRELIQTANQQAAQSQKPSATPRQSLNTLKNTPAPDN